MTVHTQGMGYMSIWTWVYSTVHPCCICHIWASLSDNSSTVRNTKSLEYPQKRAMNIMFPGGIDYTIVWLWLAWTHWQLDENTWQSDFLSESAAWESMSSLSVTRKKMILVLWINYAIQRHFNHSLSKLNNLENLHTILFTLLSIMV